MSATPCSERRPRRHRHHLHPLSDYHDDESVDSLGPRSLSLTALSQPRMVRLESLEAKMANIEVSLSRRRRSAPLRVRPPVQSPIPTPTGETETQRRAARDKLITVRAQARDKRALITKLKSALERIPITEESDIDAKIRHAELEWRVGNEELELLTLFEEARILQSKLDGDHQEIIQFPSNNSYTTVYKCVRDLGGKAALVSVDLERWDRGSTPPFGVGVRNSRTGLWIEWALSGTGLKRDDRLVEADGKLLVTASHPADLGRLLTAPGIAVHRLVVLRTLQDSIENIKLTKRITCLEERVRELLKTGTRRNGGGYVSEPVSEGPPRKPIRLSLQKQNFDQTQQNQNNRKRSHRGHRTSVDAHI